MQPQDRGRMPKAIAAIAVALLLSGSSAAAGDVVPDDFFAHYGQRIEGVTPSAGDAKDVNAAIHVIDPWPRHARDRRIPGNGERMTGAVQRYRDVTKLPLAPQPIVPSVMGTSGASGGSTAAPPASGGSTAR